MSVFDKFFAGFTFRTSHPAFDVGDELMVIVSGMDGAGPYARIGDTVLHIEDAPADVLDAKVRVRVTEFDDTHHRGEAAFLGRVGETAF